MNNVTVVVWVPLGGERGLEREREREIEKERKRALLDTIFIFRKDGKFFKSRTKAGHLPRTDRALKNRTVRLRAGRLATLTTAGS